MTAPGPLHEGCATGVAPQNPILVDALPPICLAHVTPAWRLSVLLRDRSASRWGRPSATWRHVPGVVQSETPEEGETSWWVTETVQAWGSKGWRFKLRGGGVPKRQIFLFYHPCRCS